MAVHLICKGSRVAVRKRQEKGEDNGQTRPFMPLRGAGPGAAGRSGQRSTVPDSRSSRAQSNSEIPELLVRAVANKRGQPPSPEAQRVIRFLHTDPQMRIYFINQVAAPIANKLFDCGLIP